MLVGGLRTGTQTGTQPRWLARRTQSTALVSEAVASAVALPYGSHPALLTTSVRSTILASPHRTQRLPARARLHWRPDLWRFSQLGGCGISDLDTKHRRAALLLALDTRLQPEGSERQRCAAICWCTGGASVLGRPRPPIRRSAWATSPQRRATTLARPSSAPSAAAIR